jgi:hypothetical protein
MAVALWMVSHPFLRSNQIEGPRGDRRARGGGGGGRGREPNKVFCKN